MISISIDFRHQSILIGGLNQKISMVFLLLIRTISAIHLPHGLVVRIRRSHRRRPGSIRGSIPGSPPPPRS